MEAMCRAYTPQDSRNLKIFNWWSIGTAIAFAGTTLLLAGHWIERGPIAWGLAILSVAAAFMMVRSYMVFLRNADELLRKIQLEGLALGFGAGALFMLGYRLFERLGAPKLDMVDPLPVMVVFWAVGQYIGHRRYSGGGDGK